ncbi:MAG: hypothetical protein GTO30_07285 [Acidobacteria bacterium]|nr:hypothetical protein [Acidobacteriota bacterium]NIQ85735.1 hypothetical protein [Acidobacteriota bacterium]
MKVTGPLAPCRKAAVVTGGSAAASVFQTPLFKCQRRMRPPEFAAAVNSQ